MSNDIKVTEVLGNDGEDLDLRELYSVINNRSESRHKSINTLINQIIPLIKTPADADVLGDFITNLLKVSVDNDKLLIKNIESKIRDRKIEIEREISIEKALPVKEEEDTTSSKLEEDEKMELIAKKFKREKISGNKNEISKYLKKIKKKG